MGAAAAVPACQQRKIHYTAAQTHASHYAFLPATLCHRATACRAAPDQPDATASPNNGGSSSSAGGSSSAPRVSQSARSSNGADPKNVAGLKAMSPAAWFAQESSSPAFVVLEAILALAFLALLDGGLSGVVLTHIVIKFVV